MAVLLIIINEYKLLDWIFIIKYKIINILFALTEDTYFITTLKNHEGYK